MNAIRLEWTVTADYHVDLDVAALRAKLIEVGIKELPDPLTFEELRDLLDDSMQIEDLLLPALETANTNTVLADRKVSLMWIDGRCVYRGDNWLYNQLEGLR